MFYLKIALLTIGIAFVSSCQTSKNITAKTTVVTNLNSNLKITDIQNNEFKLNTNAFTQINLAEAYQYMAKYINFDALGGKGVKVGILEAVDTDIVESGYYLTSDTELQGRVTGFDSNGAKVSNPFSTSFTYKSGTTEAQKAEVEKDAIHANKVMSILAAARNNITSSADGSRMQGVAYAADLYFTRLFGFNNFNPLIDAGSRIINMSFGLDTQNPALYSSQYDRLESDYGNFFKDRIAKTAVVFVAAASNDRFTIKNNSAYYGIGGTDEGQKLSDTTCNAKDGCGVLTIYNPKFPAGTFGDNRYYQHNFTLVNAAQNPNPIGALAGIVNDSASKGVYITVAASSGLYRDGGLTKPIMATYSNLCGSSAAYCITAPGGDGFYGDSITTKIFASNGNDQSPTQGTSVAAPIVSGIIANIISAFPSLDIKDVVQFMFKGAKPAYQDESPCTKNINDSCQTDYSNPGVDYKKEQESLNKVYDQSGAITKALYGYTKGGVDLGGKNDRKQGENQNNNLSKAFGWGVADLFFTLKMINNSSYGFQNEGIVDAATSTTPAKSFTFGNTAFVGSGVVGAAGFEGVRAAALGAVFTDAFGYTFAADLGDKSFISNGLGGFKNPYYNSVTYNTLGGYTNSYNGFFNSATSAAFGGFGVVGTGLSDSALSNMYSFGGYAGLNYKQGLYSNALANDFTAASFGSSKSSSSFARALNGDSLGSFVKDIYLGLASIGGGSFKGNAAAGQFIFGLDGFGSGFAGVATSGAAAAGLNAAASGFNSINIGTDTTFNNFAARFTNLSTSLNLSQLGAGSESYLASLGSLAGSSLSGSGLASNITSKDAANVKSFALGSSASSGLGFFSATSSSFINPLIYSSATSSTGYGFVSGANNANPLNANFASSASAFTGLGGLGSANIGFGGAYYNPASLINLNLNPLVRGFTEGGSGSLGANPYLASQNSVKNFNLALGGVAVAYSQNAILQNSSSFANSMLQGFAGSSYRLGFKTGSKSALSLSASSLTPRTSAFAGLGGASGASGNVSDSSGSSTLSGDNITTRLNTRGFNTRLLEASFTHSPNKNLAYDIKLGYMNESGSFLSNLVSGAFSVNGAKSFFTELLLHANLNQRLGISFDGSLGLGMTKVNAISGLLFDSFSNLTTSSAALRLTKHGLLLGSAGIDTTKAGNGGNGGYLKAIKKAGFKAIDAVSLSVSAPYAISSGSAIVNGIGSNGSNASGANAGGTGKVANFGQSRVSLAAGMSSRQIDTGLSYRLALSSLSSAVYVDGGNGSLQGYKIKKHRAVTEAALSLSITHSQNYNHTKNLSTNTLALGIFIGG